MSYPNLPNNRLIVNGVDLSERFKMVLLDGYTLTPPSLKTYTVDIPGGNGKIDLTESLFGDVTYNNRSMEFYFVIIDVDNFEEIKTEITNFLHGKSSDFQITMDPGYTYHGRFNVSETKANAFNHGIVGQIKITIDGEPFKYRDTQIRSANAVGGNTYYFESGRERVCPTLEVDGFLRIIYDHKQIDLQQGTWKINDILFKEGTNEIYLNSYPFYNITWGDLKNKKSNLTNTEVEIGNYYISDVEGERGSLIKTENWVAHKLEVKPNTKYSVIVNTAERITPTDSAKILCAVYSSDIIDPEMTAYMTNHTEAITAAAANETYRFEITTASTSSYMVVVSDGDVHSVYEENENQESVTWSEFSKKPLHKWYTSNSDGSSIVTNWNPLINKTWYDISDKTWKELVFYFETAKDIKDVYITYEWGDL